MARQPPRMDRFTERGEAQHFDFMAQAPESESFGRYGIELAEAIGVVGGPEGTRVRLAPEQLAQASLDEASRAVKNTVAASIRRVNQRVVVVGMEQRGQSMRKMMIVECYSAGPKALVREKAPRVE